MEGWFTVQIGTIDVPFIICRYKLENDATHPSAPRLNTTTSGSWFRRDCYTTVPLNVRIRFEPARPLVCEALARDTVVYIAD